MLDALNKSADSALASVNDIRFNACCIHKKIISMIEGEKSMDMSALNNMTNAGIKSEITKFLSNMEKVSSCDSQLTCAYGKCSAFTIDVMKVKARMNIPLESIDSNKIDTISNRVVAGSMLSIDINKNTSFGAILDLIKK